MPTMNVSIPAPVCNKRQNWISDVFQHKTFCHERHKTNALDNNFKLMCIMFSYYMYINSNEIPSELPRENISSHVTITCYFHTWKDHTCYGYISKSRFSMPFVKWFSITFIGVYIINKTLHGRLEIYEISLLVLKNILQHSKRNFASLRGHVISSIYTIVIFVRGEIKKRLWIFSSAQVYGFVCFLRRSAILKSF